MKSISIPSFMRAALILCVISTALAFEAIDQGCYSSSDPLKDQGSWTFQSQGYCQKLCTELLKPVFATTKGSNCYCGDLIPAASSKVADSKCNTKCNGYDKETCGGLSSWSVKLTGLDLAVGNVKESGSSSTSSTGSSSPSSPSSASTTPDGTSSSPPSVVVTQASTVVVTAAGQTNAQGHTTSAAPKSKGGNTAGIAAGVVVGIVAICSLAGGLYFYLRNRKRRALEDEFHRNSANAFLANGKISDARLDPSVMMQRRQSDGSIADDRDYSRRILKVTNPDGT